MEQYVLFGTVLTLIHFVFMLIYREILLLIVDFSCLMWNADVQFPKLWCFSCCRGIMADHCWRMITHRNRQSLRQRKDCCSMFGIVYRAGREKETQSFWVLRIWMLGIPWPLDNDDNASSDSNATGDVGECNCIHFDETSPWMDIPFMEMAWNLVEQAFWSAGDSRWQKASNPLVPSRCSCPRCLKGLFVIMSYHVHLNGTDQSQKKRVTRI